jgi:hypothetical protein
MMDAKPHDASKSWSTQPMLEEISHVHKVVCTCLAPWWSCIRWCVLIGKTALDEPPTMNQRTNQSKGGWLHYPSNSLLHSSRQQLMSKSFPLLKQNQVPSILHKDLVKHFCFIAILIPLDDQSICACSEHGNSKSTHQPIVCLSIIYNDDLYRQWSRCLQWWWLWVKWARFSKYDSRRTYIDTVICNLIFTYGRGTQLN